MIFEPLSLQGAFLITPEPVEDERGYFARSFCQREFAEHGLINIFPQHSLSFNRLRGTLRGLHYQSSPYQETKLVRCSRGSIFDVLVDLRVNSITYTKWLGFNLSESNGVSLYIPAGFAHGFITLEDASEVHYLITPQYAPGNDCTIRWDDAYLAVEWPMQPLVLSINDKNAAASTLLNQRD